MAYKVFDKVYIKSSASAKNVKLKGSTIETHEPYGEYNITKNNTTESKNNIQYRPVLFLVVSILIIFGKYKTELFIWRILQI